MSSDWLCWTNLAVHPLFRLMKALIFLNLPCGCELTQCMLVSPTPAWLPARQPSPQPPGARSKTLKLNISAGQWLSARLSVGCSFHKAYEWVRVWRMSGWVQRNNINQQKKYAWWNLMNEEKRTKVEVKQVNKEKGLSSEVKFCCFHSFK